jgi:hypothetical protein
LGFKSAMLPTEPLRSSKASTVATKTVRTIAHSRTLRIYRCSETQFCSLHTHNFVVFVRVDLVPRGHSRTSGSLGAQGWHYGATQGQDHSIVSGSLEKKLNELGISSTVIKVAENIPTRVERFLIFLEFA